MVIAVGLGGPSALLIALTQPYKFDTLVSMRPCKKGEVKYAKRVGAATFKVNASTVVSGKPALEGQLATKDFEVYMICLKMPWPMVLESVDELIADDVVAGDLSCACSPLPDRCFPSFMALAALGPRNGKLVTALPGRFPADAACTAVRLERASSCFIRVDRLIGQRLEEFSRLVDYLYAKAPSVGLIELRKELRKGFFDTYLFDYECYYKSSRDAHALRVKGPKDFKRPRGPCQGNLVEVMKRFGVTLDDQSETKVP